MPFPPKQLAPRYFAIAGLVTAVCLLSTACGGSGDRPAAKAETAPKRPSGPVDVLYAGSLQDLMQQVVGPAFTKATGYTVTGFSDGSRALASQIRGRTKVGDVFLSASPKVNDTLEGPANGGWVSWYAEFATSPLLLAYNPSSRFAAELKSRPWYEVVGQGGFRLGRTDPVTDPKGVLAVSALRETASADHLPSLAKIAASSANVFPETSLLGELQAGQLDAGFFYGVEAAAAGLDTVPLSGVDLSAHYTITVLRGAPHQAAAVAFVSFLLGAPGRAILEKNRLVPKVPVVVSGRPSVPAELQNVF